MKKTEVKLSEESYSVLAVLTQGDVTSEELKERIPKPWHLAQYLQAINKQFGNGTVVNLEKHPRATYRLIGAQINPVLKIEEAKVARRLTRRKPPEESYRINPTEISLKSDSFSEDYLNSLPPTERKTIIMLKGSSLASPYAPTTNEAQVFEMMIRVGAYPEGHQIKRAHSQDGAKPRYYLERR